MADPLKPVADLIYEPGVLSRVRRSGWWLAGVDRPESVAEHSFRAALIAFVLAEMEGADPEKAAAMALFHDLHEARVLDMHKVGQRYADWEEAEAKAIGEQLARLPRGLKERISGYKHDFQGTASPEAIIARDADHLECLVRAREYQEAGNPQVGDWIANSRSRLRTASARKLAAQCLRTGPQGWWEGLKRRIMEDRGPKHRPLPRGGRARA
jgi:putative hydrolase of HD superfamily